MAARCLLPALGKVAGDLPEGYLGAGIRRERAPRKAPDLPLKGLEAAPTRRGRGCGRAARPRPWEGSRWRAPSASPRRGRAGSQRARAFRREHRSHLRCHLPAAGIWLDPLSPGGRCQPVPIREAEAGIRTTVQRAWGCQAPESGSGTHGAVRLQGWTWFPGGGCLRSGSSFPHRGPLPKSWDCFSEALSSIQSLTLPEYL